MTLLFRLHPSQFYFIISILNTSILHFRQLISSSPLLLSSSSCFQFSLAYSSRLNSTLTLCRIINFLIIDDITSWFQNIHGFRKLFFRDIKTLNNLSGSFNNSSCTNANLFSFLFVGFAIVLINISQSVHLSSTSYCGSFIYRLLTTY